ncbi:hypothetical protein NQ318_013821 [Aromia moschata]|uniref:Uncharacterized protein n=1 Tax=Aromia moschata TaxID=1265417 RepID=A0AAV8Z8R5_9CUCU|nr:hypothetical protein NQ318_013821 [Aromia moschata]
MYTDVSQYLDWIEDKSGLDAAIVNLIYTRTPAPKPITEDCTTNASDVTAERWINNFAELTFNGSELRCTVCNSIQTWHVKTAVLHVATDKHKARVIITKELIVGHIENPLGSSYTEKEEAMSKLHSIRSKCT